eukprot:jgi/Ulvmu1/9797/UM056_0037.1
MWHKLRSSFQQKQAAALLEQGAVFAVPDERPNEEPEEFDLIALTSTPEQFKEPEFDVNTFELNNLPAQSTLPAIDELKELRQRQLDVQVQQLVHHVSANTDNLTAGIQTCRSVGGLLETAIASCSQGRQHMQSAEHDAGTSLKVAALHRRNQNLADVMAALSDVLFIQQKAAEAEAAVYAAQAAVESGEPGSVVMTCQAMLLLAAQYQQLNEPHLKPLTTQQPLLQRCIGLQSLLDDLVAAAVQRVCAAFDPVDLDSLVALHVLNVQTGAEMPELIRDAYLALVSSSDQFSSISHPPCALQTALYREAQQDAPQRSQGSADTLHGSDLSLAALFKAVPALKFRSRAEWLMQTQFEWLQSFHAMQLHVQDELAAVRRMLMALAEGGEAAVDWASGLPRVTLSADEGGSQLRGDSSPSGGGQESGGRTPPFWGEHPPEAACGRREARAPLRGSSGESSGESVAENTAERSIGRGLAQDGAAETTAERGLAGGGAKLNGHAADPAAAAASAAPKNCGSISVAAADAAGSQAGAESVERGLSGAADERRAARAERGEPTATDGAAAGGAVDMHCDRGAEQVPGAEAAGMVRLLVNVCGKSSVEVDLLAVSQHAVGTQHAAGHAANVGAPAGALHVSVGGAADGQMGAAGAAPSGMAGCDEHPREQESIVRALVLRAVQSVLPEPGADSAANSGAIEGSRVVCVGSSRGGAAEPAQARADTAELSAQRPVLQAGAESHRVQSSDGLLTSPTPPKHADGGELVAVANGAAVPACKVEVPQLGKVATGEQAAGAAAAADAHTAPVAPQTPQSVREGSQRSGSARAHGAANGSLAGFAQSPGQNGAVARLGRSGGSYGGARSAAGVSVGWKRAGSCASATRVAVESHGSIGSLVGKPQSVEDFLKQRERILHGVAASLSRCRMEFGRQAARNVIKMYEACHAIQSESFRTLLRHGLDFSAIVTAFCAERPDDVDGGGERLPHDYLNDVVKTTCGQRLFGAYAREQRDILMADLLPMEQCEMIAVRPPKRVAAAATAGADAGSAAEDGRNALPFAYWAARHAFQKRPDAARHSRGGSDCVLPSAESLKLFSESMVSGRGTAQDTATASVLSSGLSQGTPHSPITASAAAADSSDNPADADSSQRVFLQSTRHIARAWAVYGSLLPVFKSTADVPLQIMRAVQSLFEEFLLWTVVTFAGVTPATVVRGVNGKDDRFFRVVWSLMLRSDRASRTRRYGQQLQAVVQAADKGDAAKADAVGSSRPSDVQEAVGLGGGTLDRLVRGTIACDALATLAQDLLELEPVLKEAYAPAGDQDMRRMLCELFAGGAGASFPRRDGKGSERVHGCVHEVESVRRRCVEGSVVHNLQRLETSVQAKLRAKSYVASSLADASSVEWLLALRADLHAFVHALVCCTESRRLSRDSLQEIWQVAVLHIDKVVLAGLAECVSPGGKMKGLMASMVNATKTAEKRQAKKGLSAEGCMQLSAEVGHLVRLLAQAQPEAAGDVQVVSLMTVPLWAEGCHNELVAAKPTEAAQQAMIAQWMSWAATCHRGTDEGKSQCLALFTALQKLKGVPDSCPWIRELKTEVLA